MYRVLSPGAVGIRANLREAVDLAAEAGFEGINIGLREAMDIGLDEVRDLLDKKGLMLGSWGFPVDVRGDDASYEKSLKTLPELADIGQALGCLRASTYILSFSDDLPFEKNFQRHVDRLRPAAEILAARGCQLGLEFLGPKTLRTGHPYEFVHTMEGMLELADRVGTGNLGLLLDCWHWYTAHGTVEDLRKLRDADVVDVHVNDAPAGIPIDEQVDNVRRMPGETGVIDIVGFLRALDEIGYTGPVMAEPFSEEVRRLPAPDAARVTMESLRKIWRQAGLE